ncbi:short chain dehydrogenase/reductase family [Aspergillus keveii]|uniref:Short chain dehydrogenase/reductase family n=1 Tax=Aspergillus keveii TaxID=714993 RepID=A0ABR4FMJ6_9EURO
MSSFDIKTLFGVKDLVAVVTGGGSGLGRVISRALATNGARRVYILGRRLNALHETASAHPEIIVPIVADVTDPSSLTAAAEQIREEVGYVDFLVAGAGMVYLHPPPPPAPDASLALSSSGKIQVGRILPPSPTAAQVESFLLGTTPDEFLTSYRVNTMGVFYTIAAFISLLDAGNRRPHDDSTKGDSEQQEAKGEEVQVKRKSHVVTIASVSGQNNNATGGCAYGMSKAAVIQLMGQMMRVLAPLGIRGNTLSPGVFPSNLAGTPANYAMTAEGTFPMELIPLRRAGTDQEMAGTILYLASRAGGYVNGHVLVVDGGNLGYP